MLKNLKINCPTKLEVKKYLDAWSSNKNFYIPENALKKLFKNHFLNEDINDVLIKTYALNDAYRTSIFWPIDVTENILNMRIDNDLSKGDISVIDKISKKDGKGKFEFDRKDKNGEIIKGKKIKIEFYSFATKYASFHQPDKYPIFDSNVERTLIYFKTHCSDCSRKFTFNNNLREYKNFKNITKNFQEVFSLQEFCFRDIDKYLYLVGKKIKKEKEKDKAKKKKP